MLSRLATVGLLCLLCCTFSAADTSIVENDSIAFIPSRGTGSAPLPLTSSLLAAPASGTPTQVHLTYVSPTEIIVSWSNDEGTIVNGPLDLPADNAYITNSTDDADTYVVMYGTTSSNPSMMASGYSTSYQQIYTGFIDSTTGASNGNPILNYTSAMIYHVPLTGLSPDTMYFYQVTGENGTMSAEYNFTTLPTVGTFPLVMGVFADIGQTSNSSQTISRMTAQEVQVVTLIGDFTYSDDHLTNGTSDYVGFPNNTYSDAIPSPSGSYQPRWDSWFRLAEPLLAHVPLISNAGNHELEPQGGGNYFTEATWGLDNGLQFNSYLARNPVPYQVSGGAPLYYSVNVGPVHMIILCNYEDFLEGSAQYDWLLSDLASVDRSVTPWIVAQWHAPWYSSYTTHYKETECMREAMEPIFYEYGVDIVFNGHLHEYERTNSVYNYTVDPCGAVHITIGDGGNIEGLYTTFIDGPNVTADCPKPDDLPSYQPGPYCPSFTYNPDYANGYCPDHQPEWSAFREPAFGHGVMVFENETHALWEWNRNWDSGTEYLDTVYIIRDTTCTNYNGPSSTALSSS